jgi:hypothetical protein
MARAILDRTDISTIVIRAVKSELPGEDGRRGGGRPSGKGARAA